MHRRRPLRVAAGPRRRGPRLLLAATAVGPLPVARRGAVEAMRDGGAMTDTDRTLLYGAGLAVVHVVMRAVAGWLLS